MNGCHEQSSLMVIMNTLKKFNPAVCRCLDVAVNDYFSIAFRLDAACSRILYASNWAVYGGMHAAVFKCKVAAAVHYAVFKYQIFSIAKGLRT